MRHTTPTGYLLNANYVEVGTTYDVLMVTFADLENEDEPSYLVLQRLIGGDAESRAQQAVYIELNDQSYSAYEGIDAAVLEPDHLSIQLDAATAERLGLEEAHLQRILVSFECNLELLGGLQGALQQIFSDHTGYQDRAGA